VDWLESAAARDGDHPAIVALGQATTYAELHAEAERAARRLATRAVGEGARVATTLPAGPELAALLFGAARVGAALVPLDTRLAEAGRRAQLGAAAASVVVDQPLDGPEEDYARPGADSDRVLTVIFTSGTTGAPRPVELTVGNHLASARAARAALGTGPDDRWLSPLPVFHIGGLAVIVRCAIAGATALLHRRFDPEAVAAELAGGRASLASLVPTMLARLRDAGLHSAPGLRAMLLGGGPVPDRLLEWARERGIRTRPSYGMTETCSQVAVAEPWERAARPGEGAELRIGEEGEILVRGPMVAAAAVAPDGWLHTGDRGRIDERGLLHVEGRLKELIVSGGENVAPAEVERALLSHPAVEDAGVAGVSDPEWGEAIVAFVVLADGASEHELIAHCRERLAPHKVPKRVEPVAALPRNAAGKLLRSELGASRRTPWNRVPAP
jgi:o-succinylbenzoate---CoA ligase